MNRTLTYLVLAVLLLLLFAVAFVMVYNLLRAVSRGKRRIRLAELRNGLADGTPPPWLLLVCGVRAGKREVWAERGQLLAGAGLRIQPLWYVCFKRMCAALLLGTGILLWRNRGSLETILPLHPIALSALAGGLYILVLCDRTFLDSLKQYRRNRIVEEIFTVSRQLLYFSGSPLNLHGKLSKCTPYTKLIRQEWHLLLNDWYHDPEGAVAKFRYRLGTEEAYGFSETLQSLRLYDGEAYYGLLRQRVQDFKEKLELIRDSRKESVSYVLFVLAGIPIMYTFQIFLHPWVQEGKRLFNGLQ